MRCEITYRIETWPYVKRCEDEAVERLTVSVGHPERATGIFEGAACQKHRLDAQGEEGINVLYEPLAVTPKPEDN